MSTMIQRKSAVIADERGQIALIVLLIMAVVLTIGLAVASRTVMDVSLSRQEQNGSQTFQAAESGVETALNKDLSTYTNGASVVTNQSIGASNVNATVNLNNAIETRVSQGDSIQVQIGVVPAGAGRVLRLNWSKGDPACSASAGAPNKASLIIRVYNQNGAAYTSRNYAIAACNIANGYTVAGSGTNGYFSTYDVPLAVNDKFVSVHPLGADTQISAVGAGGVTLPTQYYTINSTATNTNGTETKAITVTKTVAGAPGILDYTLYSGSSLIQ